MFLNEPIRAIYSLELSDACKPKECDALLVVAHRLEYHATCGYWYLFETDSFYVTVGYDGVVKYEKPYDFSAERYEISPLGMGDGSEYEDIIFVGQHICSVENVGYTLVSFDDFALRLYTYGEEGLQICSSRGIGDKAVPVGSHLLKKCSCGGNPEIYLDSQDDFFIRCDRCHSRTAADMWFGRAVDAWKRGDTPFAAEVSRENFDKAVKEQSIKRILLCDESLEECGEDSCRAEEIIIEFERVCFLVSGFGLGEDESRLCIGDISGYNSELYSRIISPDEGEIEYIGVNTVYGREELILLLRDRRLTISANGRELELDLEKPYEYGGEAVKRGRLFS